VRVQQHIFGLHIAVNQFLLVSIVQGICGLLYIGYNLYKGKTRATGIALEQGAIGGVAHDQERGRIVNTIFQHAYDMGVV